MRYQKNTNSDVTINDVQFFDNYVPALEAGSYYISVNHELTTDKSKINFDARQEILVSAPQFTLDSTQIINKYPPLGSTGKYGEVIPHIVFKDPALPWERFLSKKGTPWLALMVFVENELNNGQSHSDKSSEISINEFLKPATTTLIGDISKEKDIDGNTTCRFINMSTKIFKDIAPTLEELPFLSHIRKINTANRPDMNLHEEGLFSVITANRFATAPTPGNNSQAIKNIVHLVSLEGLEQYLSATSNLNKYDNVSLITLASWTFLSAPDNLKDFKTLLGNLVLSSSNGTNLDRSSYSLRLPEPKITNTTNKIRETIIKRTKNGFVPLAYHTRSGEDTFAWYRGPLTPVLTKNLGNTFPTTDAALIYDKTNGVFDVSLASAWETGREVALADRDFIKKLNAFRNQNNNTAASLFNHLHSGHFSNKNKKLKKIHTTIQENFMALLTPRVIREIGNIADKRVIQKNSRATTASVEEFTSIHTFLEEPDVQEKLKKSITKYISPVADWLEHFALLYPIPFDKLVADEKMLPPESIRFFYLDMNWINAGIQGAMSLGVDSGKQFLFNRLTIEALGKASMVMKMIKKNKKNARSTSPKMMCGFLLRSALVSGWPNLSIQAVDKNNQSLTIMRLDHLSPNVLLCIFDDVPKTIELCEPQESLGFGVSSNGSITLRKVLNDSSIGTRIKTIPIRDLSFKQKYCMRSAESNVLNIAPSDPNGLIQKIAKELKINNLTPATFAIQMIKTVEAIKFDSQTI
ncbi:hypothetical protein DVR12_19680 [Chitinophaga silvatica]|uniref:Uncharacterized protein n=1 Tax=Chitinophaga silvatica TaxID=2282649 RepID=A0A3E1Y5E1_9BACT|nr:hypothetical protein [Chitinophaga silvatica]RFS19953.1 hypothetical protein DVR12_19680 [Chitinophaga silvatica]